PGGDPLGPGPGGCTQNFPSRNHIGHTHNFGGIEHRTQVQEVDLVPALNPGATYFGEVHYITPHEYTAGNGNQNNNVSHGPFEVQGPDVNGFYQFIEAGATSFESPSVDSWPGAVQTHIEPAQLRDGKAVLAYKATDLGAGQWHYEYAIYNMNLGRGVGSFGVPLPSGVTLSNVGFHAPLNHAPEANAENYTNDPWVAAAGGGMFTWSTDPFAVNPLANAIRWGTLYNFRFDADTPPRSVLATVGMFKTGELLAAVTIGPAPTGPQDCNNNGLDDLCDLDCNLPGCNVPGCGLGIDCNGNAVPDTCELDCNGNGIDDSCDIANQTDTDCNRNNIPDGCETDCDGNGTADTCDISADRTRDCQRNGVLDVCEAPNPQTVGACCHPDLSCSETVPAGCIGADVFQGLCTNCAETLCQPPPPLNPPLAAFPPHDRAKNRYVSFVPNSPGPVAFMIGKVTGTAGAGWVGTPNASGIAGVLPLMPTPRNWPEPVVHVGDCPVVPDADYEIRATMDGITFSPALTVSTTPQPAPKFWGDTVGDFQSLCSVGGTACGPVGSTCNGTGVCGMWTAPNGVVSVNDFLAALQKFQGVVTAPHVTVVDVVGAGQPGQQSCLNRAGNIGDVFNLIKAFQGDAYPFTTDPAACPVCP
ncbi:MAG: hypothetical protein HY763_08165, partial [Planctomycetes bacterium]|nr:hypothetical protein [Planctomycetota bacterium]